MLGTREKTEQKTYKEAPIPVEEIYIHVYNYNIISDNRRKLGAG